VETRKYRDDEPVGIGDTVKVPDPFGGPFEVAIVVHHDKDSIFCERIHAMSDRCGQLSIMINKIKFSREDFKNKVEVFIIKQTGHKHTRLL